MCVARGWENGQEHDGPCPTLAIMYQCDGRRRQQQEQKKEDAHLSPTPAHAGGRFHEWNRCKKSRVENDEPCGEPEESPERFAARFISRGRLAQG